MNLKNLADYIIEKMKRELPSTIVYHNVVHTLDVHDAVVRIGGLEGLNENEIHLLRAAALLHDSGVTVSFEDHEEHSAKIAEELLPSFDFNPKEIEIIKKLIMATKLPQTAETLMEKVICDADLDYLGRADFFVTSQKLRLEWAYAGKTVNLTDWYVIQMNFLRNHEYHTQTAIRLRNARKLDNLREIEHLCANGCDQKKK